MKKVLPLVALFLVLSFSLAFAKEDPVLATYNGKKMTLSDFNRIVNFYDKQRQQLLESNPGYRTTLLKRYVEDAVIAKIAKEKGFDKRADIKEQIKLLVDDFLTMQYIKKEIIGNIDASESDVRQYYTVHQDAFMSPEQVRVRHILIKAARSAPADVKKKAKEKIEGILKKIKAGEDFAKLAREFSDDPGSKAKGGDLGFFGRGVMVPSFEKVAFSLKPGQVSDVFETRYGFEIVKCEAKKEPALEPFDKVKDQVKKKMIADFRQQRVDEFVRKALTDAGVKFDFKPLESSK